jgi:hypothetical protein
MGYSSGANFHGFFLIILRPRTFGGRRWGHYHPYQDRNLFPVHGPAHQDSGGPKIGPECRIVDGLTKLCLRYTRMTSLLGVITLVPIQTDWHFLLPHMQPLFPIPLAPTYMTETLFLLYFSLVFPMATFLVWMWKHGKWLWKVSKATLTYIMT